MATPHVSDAALLMLSKCALNTASLKTLLLNAVDPIPSLTDLTATGGRLNVSKAIRACAAPANPDFALSAMPASQTVTQGGSTTYTVNISPSGGFTRAVSLSAAGLPTGASASFSPNPASASSTMTVGTGAATPPGSYTLTITGASGTLTRTTSVTLTVNPAPVPDFGLSATPASQSVVQGAGTTYAVSITPSGGFTEIGRARGSGWPGGATASFSPNPATASSTMTVATGAATPPGSYTLTITGVSGTLTRTTSVTLPVNPAPVPDFGLSATPASQSVVQGAGTTYAVSITPSGGFTEIGRARGSGWPGGATASFSPNPATASSTMTVATGAATPPGSYTLTITGVSGTLTRTTSVTLPVNPAPVPDFGLSATPASQSVVQGAGTTYAVSITPSGGFTEIGRARGSGWPGGATASFSPNPATASSTMTVATGAATPPGSYTLTITGVSGTLTRTTSVTLPVNPAPVPDFGLSATPASQSVVQGAGTTYAVSITPSGGFTEIGRARGSGWPGGATASFSPNPATASSTMTVATGAATPPGSYTLTITGVSGTLTRTTSVTLPVNPAPVPDFGLSATPASQSVVQGAGTTYAVSITPSGGFTEIGRARGSGWPGGATASFSPNPATASSTMTVATGAATPPGSYTLTITGVSGTLTRTTSVTLPVNPAPVPDFGLSATPASQSVVQGAGTTYAVSITPSGGFTAAVTFGVSGLTGGATASFSANRATASSTMTVGTGAATPPGSYALTITGVSGTLTPTTSVTLTLSLHDALPICLSATPASQSVVQGAGTTYAVSITPSGGFTAAVIFTVSG